MPVKASDANRLFLQAVFSRKFMSEEMAKLLLTKSREAVRRADPDVVIHNTPFEEVIAVLNNDSLTALQLEMRSLHDEATGKRMWALVNTRGDEVAQMATEYAPQEIVFFKQIIEQIMLAPNEAFSISSFAALREAGKIPKPVMPKTQAEIVLRSFVMRGWLLQSKRGRYSLSARTVLELLQYLKNTYEDEILECTICMEICTKGLGCFTNNCATRMHHHCYDRYTSTTHKCPTCGKDWPDRTKLSKIGEEAARDSDNEKRQVRRRDDEEDDDEEPPESSVEPEARSQKKKAGKRAATSDTNDTMESSSAADDQMDVDQAEVKREKVKGDRRQKR